MLEIASKPLAGKEGLVVGVADEQSIAYGGAQSFRAPGADPAMSSSILGWINAAGSLACHCPPAASLERHL
jgi:hypothetical protein